MAEGMILLLFALTAPVNEELVLQEYFRLFNAIRYDYVAWFYMSLSSEKKERLVKELKGEVDLSTPEEVWFYQSALQPKIEEIGYRELMESKTFRYHLVMNLNRYLRTQDSLPESWMANKVSKMNRDLKELMGIDYIVTLRGDKAFILGKPVAYKTHGRYRFFTIEDFERTLIRDAAHDGVLLGEKPLPVQPQQAQDLRAINKRTNLSFHDGLMLDIDRGYLNEEKAFKAA